MPSIKIKGKSLAFDEAGSGKSVVFVHGACENSSFWNHQKVLSDRYRIITMDLPGHGKSESMDSEILIRNYSEIVSEFIAKTCPEKAVLVGHSMGGAIALLNVIEHCQNLKGAVIVSSGAKSGSTSIHQGRLASKVRRDRKVGRRAEAVLSKDQSGYHPFCHKRNSKVQQHDRGR